MEISMSKEQKRAIIGDKSKLEMFGYLQKYLKELTSHNITREKLAEKMQQDINWEGKAPEVEVLSKWITKNKKGFKGPQEKSWSISSLDDYPIPPQSLPAVLKAYRQHKEKGIEFTIRQAKWESRLSATDYSVTIMPDIIARTELLYELTGSLKETDFTTFDKLLAGMEGTSDKDGIPMAFWATASVAGILGNDPTKQLENNSRMELIQPKRSHSQMTQE
jgi:hypothetical protein